MTKLAHFHVLNSPHLHLKQPDKNSASGEFVFRLAIKNVAINCDFISSNPCNTRLHCLLPIFSNTG